MNGDRKGEMQPRKNWRNMGLGKGDKPDCCKGDTPVFKKTVKGQECEWCAKCNHGQGKWTATHDKVNHQKDFDKEDVEGKLTKSKANIVDSTHRLQPMILIAECCGLPARTSSRRKHGGNRRQSTEQIGR